MKETRDIAIKTRDLIMPKPKRSCYVILFGTVLVIIQSDVLISAKLVYSTEVQYDKSDQPCFRNSYKKHR